MKTQINQAANGTSEVASEDDSEAPSEQPVFTKRVANPEQAFEDFYLRQVTKEFGNDLEKLRNASDFQARSVDVLVEALRQGTSCFSKEDRAKIGSAASAGS